MRLLSVNLGQSRPDGDRRTKTGIYKEAALGPVFVGRLGFAGDAVLNKKHHGGRDQAAYLYAAEDYAWWSEELSQELAPGTFGENLTTAGLDVNGLAVGDRLRIGEVELQVTSPRIPCATLARRMGDPTFVERYLAARRPGAYCRVLGTGHVAAGDPIEIHPYEGECVALLEFFDTFHHPVMEEAALRRLLAAPLAERARAQKEAQLATVLRKAARNQAVD